MRDQQLKKEGDKLPQYIAALSVCLGSVATGAVLGWTSNVSNEMQNSEYNDIEIDESSLGWIGSFATLGAMISCFPIGILCDKIGRKPAMLLLTIPFTCGWLLILFANGVIMIYFGRLITGFAGGAFCVSAPMYTSEIAEKSIRGALGSYFQLLLTVGILFAYIMGKSVNIKIYTIILAVVPLVFAVAFLFQPETPVYCLKKNKEDEARKSLIRLRGKDYDAEYELQEIKTSLEAERNLKISLSQSLRKKSTKTAALVCFSLMFFQQACGVNAVIFYTGDIFTTFSTGDGSLDPKIATIIVGAIQSVSTFLASLVIDKLGRKILLMVSALFMFISLVLLGASFSILFSGSDIIDSIGFLPILALSIFMITFSIGFGPIPWMISSELFPPEIKSKAISAAATFNWFMAFLITKFYLDIRNAIGGDVTFYIFSGISLAGAVFVFFLVPETKGKSLEEIQIELNS